MGHDTTRRALRAALPPFLFGFFVWVLSVGLHAVTGFDLVSALSERLRLGLAARVLGAVAAGLVLAGGAHLATARVRNRRVAYALLFFGLWTGEMVLRLWTLAADPERTFDLLAARILLSNLAMICLASAMLQITGEAGREPVRSWATTRRAFALQLFLGAALWFALSADHLAPDRRAGLVDAALWLVLTVPYAHAYLSLQRTVKQVASTETVAEILSS